LNARENVILLARFLRRDSDQIRKRLNELTELTRFPADRLDDIGLILQGAIPAAALALLVQFIFTLLDRIFIPRGLRIKSADS
jgi:hypothetical protein